MIAGLIMYGAYSWRKKITKGKITSSIDRKYNLVAQDAISSALHIIGISLSKSDAPSKKTAIQTASDLLSHGSIGPAIVVNTLAQAFATRNIQTGMVDAEHIPYIGLKITKIIASKWDIDEEFLWNKSGQYINKKGTLDFLMQKVLMTDSDISYEILESNVLRSMVLSAIDQVNS